MARFGNEIAVPFPECLPEVLQLYLADGNVANADVSASTSFG